MANKGISTDLEPIISHSRLLSIEWQHGFINHDHLFVAMLKNKCEATQLLGHCDTAMWEEKVKKTYPAESLQKNKGSVPLTKVAERTIKHAFVIARQDQQPQINSTHLLLAILSFDNEITGAFNKAGIIIEDITAACFKKAIKKFPRILKPVRERNYSKQELFFLTRQTRRERIISLIHNAADLYAYHQFNDSITSCTVGLSLIPGCVEFKRILAYDHLRLHNYESALSLLLELMDEYPEDKDYPFSASYIFDVMGKYEEAASLLDQLLVKEPDNVGFLNNRGFNLFRQQRYRESVPFFEKAILQDPEFAYSYNNLGFAKYELGDTVAGTALIDKSLGLDKGNSFAYKHKGIIAMEQGNNNEAKRYFDLALKYGYSEKYGDEVEKLLLTLAP